MAKRGVLFVSRIFGCRPTVARVGCVYITQVFRTVSMILFPVHRRPVNLITSTITSTRLSNKFSRKIRDDFYVFLFLQSQALALTHKASPPSRPSSVSSLPRSPPSHQLQQQQQQQQQCTPQPSSIHSTHQSQPAIQATTQPSPFTAHNQHPKQEVNSSPKQEGFDLSKSSTVAGEL